jgi:hypothetical protein
MHTRRFLAVTAGLFALAAQITFAAPKSNGPKSLQFFGKLTTVNAADHSITVHNKKNNQDGMFQLSDDTRVTENKQSISPKELKVGQSLVVYYVSENDIAQARRISVRTPFGKKKAEQQ